MFQEMLENVRGKCPLIHNITNYVTVNDVANALLACGGSPIMADDIGEVADISEAIFSGVVLQDALLIFYGHALVRPPIVVR